MDFSGSFTNLDLVKTIKEEAERKGLPSESVFSVLEEALCDLSKKKYGNRGVQISVDRNSGAVSCYRNVLVVEDLKDIPKDESLLELPKVLLSYIKMDHPKAEIGDVITEMLPAITLSDMSFKSAKQAIYSRMWELERTTQYNAFKDKEGEIVLGKVQKIDLNIIVINIGGVEACLPLRHTIRGEFFKKDQEIKAYVESVEKKEKGYQILLSRIHNGFLAKLMEEAVPEISDRIIEIKGIVREAGSRAKIAVYSTDRNIDAVGSCIGVRGLRIQQVISELKGEKIDVIQYSSDPAVFVVNAIAPAKVIKLVIDEDLNKIDLIVTESQLSLAIGKKGQNVRLASLLSGWRIDIVGETDDSEKRLKEFNQGTEHFQEILNVEEVIAQLLVTEGFASIDDVATSDVEDLCNIQGFDDELAKELILRAKIYVEERNLQCINTLKDMGINDQFIEQSPFSYMEILTLTKEGITSLQHLADLSRIELQDIFPGMDVKRIDDTIMSTRRNLGIIDD